MKKSTSYLLLLLMGGMLAFHACKDEPDPVTPTTQVPTSPKYTADVSPILNESCALSGCHNAGASNGSLAIYIDVKTFKSLDKLIKAVKHEAGVKAMPLSGTKLSDAKIAILEKWISTGMPE
jgi:hypothetical protein